MIANKHTDPGTQSGLVPLKLPDGNIVITSTDDVTVGRKHSVSRMIDLNCIKSSGWGKKVII